MPYDVELSSERLKLIRRRRISNANDIASAYRRSVALYPPGISIDSSVYEHCSSSVPVVCLSTLPVNKE